MLKKNHTAIYELIWSKQINQNSNQNSNTFFLNGLEIYGKSSMSNEGYATAESNKYDQNHTNTKVKEKGKVCNVYWTPTVWKALYDAFCLRNLSESSQYCEVGLIISILQRSVWDSPTYPSHLPAKWQSLDIDFYVCYLALYQIIVK